MIFSAIVSDLADRLNLTSSESQTRLGREVNRYYRRIRTALGMADATTRAVAVSAAKTLGSATVTFSGVQKITRVYDDTSGTRRFLTEKHWDELREKNPGTNSPTEWATQSADDDTVTILINVLAQDTDALKADGFLTTTDLSGSQVPAFPEDFHDILIEGVLADEYRKRERLDLAKISKAEYEARLSDLRMWFAKSLNKANQQGELTTTRSPFLGGGGGGGSAPSGGTSYTQTGLVTFDRDPDVPFAVTSGSAVVTNLDADLLDGEQGSAYHNATNLNAGTVPLARLSGIGNTQISGTLADAIVASKLIPPGADTQVVFNDGGAFAGDSGLTFNKTSNIPTADGGLVVNGDIIGGADIILRRGTTDGSDTGVMQIVGGGSASQARGGLIQVFGNEHASLGRIFLIPGNVANSGVFVYRNDANVSVSIDGATGILSLNYGQIQFPASQNASSDANTLDDYEEGTWTPVLRFGGGSTGITYSTQSGRYTTIGNLVAIEIDIALTNKGSSTGTADIQGAPFAANLWAMGVLDGVNTFGGSVIATTWAEMVNSSINMFQGVRTLLTDADFQNTTNLRISLTYRR